MSTNLRAALAIGTAAITTASVSASREGTADAQVTRLFRGKLGVVLERIHCAIAGLRSYCPSNQEEAQKDFRRKKQHSEIGFLALRLIKELWLVVGKG
jgi:hypothetical protein